ncbi:hypothetical protein G1H11_23460 [Phytoactinopolyspora alkaliphila]|uniref:PucR family transcriptional regulator n=1 Tax=Phytoactinopolyspora alkaliphila TaxID=1783498 RepID=A0A6N9YT96_9ACTN|nr:PucR family transcriptional regulator [Phytoactinopolyspora alkaliphila]NED98263.1 hypothetical protein [Phytoactinopolyspora alkaliphila]
MSLTVREILDLPVVRAASPALMTAPRGLNHVVTWAHSSEIFEIGPLLSGGELLLTTGLGLSGADAGARRFWVRDLAQRQVAAVAIEVGRSFPALPDELADEADRCALPLIRLDRVVPFEQICRAVNTVLLDRESTALRLVDELSHQLFAALTRGGLSAVAHCVADLTARPVMVATESGQPVAVSGVASAKALNRLADRAVARASIVVDGRRWGEVLIGQRQSAEDGGTADGPVMADAGMGTSAHGHGDPWSPDVLTAAAQRTASAAAVAVAHLGDSPGESGPVATALLEELLTGNVVSEHELVVRAGLAGLHPRVGALVLGVVGNAADPVAATAALRAAGAPGGLIAGRVGGRVVAIVAAGRDDADPVGTLVDRLREHGSAEQEFSCVVGPAVPLPRAGRSLGEAYRAAEGAGPGVWAWRETLPDRLLGLLGDDDRRHLVDDVLGPLRRWDAAHGSDLVRTVEVYLRHGSSPTRAAGVLHIRRQSLHQRLIRAEELLGYALDDPAAVLPLLLASRAVGPAR